MVQGQGRWLLVSMFEHCSVAMLSSNRRWDAYETNARTDLRRAWLSRGEILTFRNARAHIRRFPIFPSPTTNIEEATT